MLRRFLGKWVALWRLGRAFLAMYWYVRRHLMPDLHLPPSAALTSREWRRIRHYVFGATYLSTVFDTLRGKRLNFVERRRLSNLAALASYFDDLVDVAAPIAHISAFAAAADKRGIALNLLEQVRTEIPASNQPLFESCLQRVFFIETAAEKPWDAAALQAVAAEKGGASVMLFRCLFEPPPSQAEQEALNVFGHFVQLSDDILDVWFDTQAGIHTTATQLIRDGQTAALSAAYKLQVQETSALLQQLPIPEPRKNTAMAMIHALAAVVYTCLFRYTQLEKRFGRLPITDRRQMVLDMAKWRNRLTAAGFYFFGN